MSASDDAYNSTIGGTTPGPQAPGDRYDKDYAYGKYDDQYYQTLVRNEARASHQWRLKLLDQMLEPRPGDRIVDLGCGAGAVSKHLAERGAAVHGVDLSEKGIEAAKRINATFPLASFKVCDASRCSHLESASFNKACSVDVIEHCGYDVMMDIFAEAHRLLEPQGLYYVYTPNPRHWIERLKASGILKQDETHTGLRPAKPILEGLQSRGFKIARHLRPASMIPVFQWFEKLWSYQPLMPELGVYRIAVLARRK